jgi:hypothetical protein
MLKIFQKLLKGAGKLEEAHILGNMIFIYITLKLIKQVNCIYHSIPKIKNYKIFYKRQNNYNLILNYFIMNNIDTTDLPKEHEIINENIQDPNIPEEAKDEKNKIKSN